MRRPDNPGRRIGDRERLITLTYKEIAEWAGLSISTVRQYASREDFDPRDIHSTLAWINTRRAAKNLIAIGHPDHVPETDTPDSQDTLTTESDVPQTPSNQVSDPPAETRPADGPSHSSSCKCEDCYQQHRLKRS